MGQPELPHIACWTAEAARSVFRTEALEGEDAVFLATHTPIKGFSVLGAYGSDLASATEQALLDALSNPTRRHAFCVVQGEPGSGKSHLIRWLRINWPVATDLPILLQRSDGSLEGAIRQLQLRLPERFSHLFDRLGQRQKATVQGRAAVFHNTLAALLRPDHYDTPLQDQEWCKRWNPAALLFSEKVLSQWKAPERILKLVSGDSERNSATARFGIFDVADLVEIVADEKFASKGARDLLRELENEVLDIINVKRATGQSADEIVAEFGGQLPYSIGLADALNRRRNDAIQNVLGVSAEGLKALFSEVRKALAIEKTRLILLLEDITAWEGLDDSLIDVLVTNADTRGDSATADLCDLISVVGVTPEYYRTLRPNYRQRITHEVQLGTGEHRLHDVVTVRDPENRVQFVARYLAATRAGLDELTKWRDEVRHLPGKRPPNKCEGCPVRIGCFHAFDSVDGVGLYPFTRHAIDGFFGALKEDDVGMTWKTPRGLIQAVLTPTLNHPEILQQGSYPGSQIDRATFTEQSQHLPSALSHLIEAKVESTIDRFRLRRLFMFWGAGGQSEIAHRSDGELIFHGVPRSVFDSFKVPWLGGGGFGDDATPVEPQVNNSSIVEPELKGELPQRTGGAGTPQRATGGNRGTEVRKKDLGTTTTTKPSKPQLDAADIRSWRTGGALRNATNWNGAAYEITRSLDMRHLGADPWVWERYLTPDLVKLAGTVQERSSHFVIPKEDWVYDGLEAYAMLTSDESLPISEVEFYRTQTARMIRHLGPAVSKFLDKRLGTTPSGQRWDPAVAAAIILLTRAWLRGVTLPTASKTDQWAALLSDEPEADSSPKARTQTWQTLLDATNKRHADLRQVLRRMVSTPQGGAPGFGLAGAQTAAAIVNLVRDLEFPDVPSEIPDQHQSTSIVETAGTLLRQFAQEVPRLLTKERDLLKSRSERVAEMLRGRSLTDHTMRVDAALSRVSAELPSVAADRVRLWKASLERLNQALTDDRQRKEVELTISQFTSDEISLPSEKTKLLAVLISARAGGLEQAVETLTTGETAIDLFVANVRQIVENAVGGHSLAVIHDAGKKLTEAANVSRRRLFAMDTL